MFAHSADPMDAEDLLRTMECELHTAQCNDRKGSVWSLSFEGSSPVLMGVLPRHPR
jgi:hypothetical protein